MNAMAVAVVIIIGALIGGLVGFFGGVFAVAGLAIGMLWATAIPFILEAFS